MVLCGPSGTGKTHLAIAIAYRAIQNGGTAVFREANHLIEELSEATGRGTLREAIEPYLHTDVLVIDELGYLTYPQDAANVLFQVVNQRYLQKKAIVITISTMCSLERCFLSASNVALLTAPSLVASRAARRTRPRYSGLTGPALASPCAGS